MTAIWLAASNADANDIPAWQLTTTSFGAPELPR
jgi:hypothetical protein